MHDRSSKANHRLTDGTCGFNWAIRNQHQYQYLNQVSCIFVSASSIMYHISLYLFSASSIKYYVSLYQHSRSSISVYVSCIIVPAWSNSVSCIMYHCISIKHQVSVYWAILIHITHLHLCRISVKDALQLLYCAVSLRIKDALHLIYCAVCGRDISVVWVQ